MGLIANEQKSQGMARATESSGNSRAGDDEREVAHVRVGVIAPARRSWS